MRNSILHYTKTLLLSASVLTIASCAKQKNEFDATGTFESTEVIVSSQADGKLLQFDVEEGQELKAGQVIGFVDSAQLYWRKQQLTASGRAIAVTKPDVNDQTATIEQQIANAEKDKRRDENLVHTGSIPRKQLDDVNDQIKVLQKQLEAQRSTVTKNANGITEQVKPIDAQIQQIQDQLAKCRIVNPVSGTVLVKYAQQDEVTGQGKPLYRIADMQHMILRAYVTGDQLSQLKQNQEVRVFIDSGAKKYRELQGKITWISDQAEFTPKTIQTKDERANLVYAIKISVQNDGYLKIGMYGEIKFL